MTTFVKTIATILLGLLAVGVLDHVVSAEEESTCSTSSTEWCGEMYLDRLGKAHQELLNCRSQHPPGPHDLCDESTEAFTQWVRPANSYLLRAGVQRVQPNLWYGDIVSEGYHTTADEKLKSLLADTVGGVQTDWPISKELIVEMGY